MVRNSFLKVLCLSYLIPFQTILFEQVKFDGHVGNEKFERVIFRFVISSMTCVSKIIGLFL